MQLIFAQIKRVCQLILTHLIFCYDSQLIKSTSLEFFQFVGKQFKGVAHCLMLAWTCTTAEFLE